VDVSAYQHADSVVIAVPPDEVWARVTDLTRMGEASPVCTGCEWDDADLGFAGGAWFAGHNDDGARQWTTRCQVVDVVPGRSFAFVNHGGGGEVDLARWGYEVEPVAAGTKLTETWKLLPGYPEFIASRGLDPEQVINGRVQAAHDGIAATLAAIKAELET